MKHLLTVGAILLAAFLPLADVGGQAQKNHGRGYKPAPPKVTARLHAEAFERHDSRIGNLPKATQTSFDAAQTFHNVLPTDDQGSCGDCFGVSSADGCSMALIKAGVLPLDSSKGRLSSQYGLDYSNAFQGGCNGGDEAQVIDYIKNYGFPLTSDYGPYTASPGRPKPTTGMKLYKIGDWGYCTPEQQWGLSTVQDMKNCIAQYGSISVAGDAGSFDSYSGGTITSNGRNVDHAILADGWDDNHDNGNGTKGAMILRNQWGEGWGITINGVSGRVWVAYNRNGVGLADSWGTEAIWMTAGSLPHPVRAPYRLFEGDKQVGALNGYPNLGAAYSKATEIANRDQKAVTIKTKAGYVVDTVQPTTTQTLIEDNLNSVSFAPRFRLGILRRILSPRCQN